MPTYTQTSTILKIESSILLKILNSKNAQNRVINSAVTPISNGACRPCWCRLHRIPMPKCNMLITCSTSLRCVPGQLRLRCTVSGWLRRWSAMARGLGVDQVKSTMVEKSTITEQMSVKGSPFMIFLALK